MARKTRKPLRMAAEVIPEISENMEGNNNIKIPTVLYCRLSKADFETGKVSMENQIELLKSAAACYGEMEIVKIFCDDGFTGTNYERPAFEEMMEGIRDGKYRCLIVKDLSRLGRSYLETSELLECELPLFGCRFISVNDRIDTDISPIDTILVGLKNIMNQKYAEDISRKIRTVFREKKEKGHTLGGQVPYGYRRNPENAGLLLIDEEAAEIVRRIFQMKISGCNDTQIARILNKEKVLCPREYAYWKKNGTVRADGKTWSADTVRCITLNETYLGHVIHGKFKEKSYLGEKDHKARRKDWTIQENINPPIITKEIFEQAKEARKRIYGRRK